MNIVNRYGNFAGFVFVFNLIVGAGSLALPLAFDRAGLVLGILFVCVVAFLAWITASWMVESIAIGNAVIWGDHHHHHHHHDESQTRACSVNLDVEGTDANEVDAKTEGQQLVDADQLSVSIDAVSSSSTSSLQVDAHSKQQQQQDDDDDDDDETTPMLKEHGDDMNVVASSSGAAAQSSSVLSPFAIERRAEVGLLAEMFLGKRGSKLFYLILVIYLYGKCKCK